MQLVFGFDDTRCIGKDDLVICRGENAFDTMPGGLHLGGNDGQLLAQQGIQQGAFARIGLSEYIYKTDLSSAENYF